MIRIDAEAIVDWESFHTVFSSAFGFPDFYGRNMDAWIDCLTCLDEPEAEMTNVHVASGQTLTLLIDHAGQFKTRCPDLFAALVECAGFVNWRRGEIGDPAVLALAFNA